MEELDRARCDVILEECRVAHLGVVDEEGRPYVTPMSYVMLDGALAFRSAPGRRDEILRTGGVACVEVVRAGEEGRGWESVIMWGTPEFVDDHTERGRVVAALLAKYHADSTLGTAGTPGPTERTVVKVVPETVTGRASGGGLAPGLRPGRL